VHGKLSIGNGRWDGERAAVLRSLEVLPWPKLLGYRLAPAGVSACGGIGRLLFTILT